AASRTRTRNPGSARRSRKSGWAEVGRRTTDDRGQNAESRIESVLCRPSSAPMLARLSIRDIVLIDRLDIDFGGGLATLTGETGAGKSILLDAFALALGARGDTAMVREGAEQGQVIAAFDLAQNHPARRLLAENDLGGEDELIMRRVQFADGRTRAFVNDQPVSVQVLRALGA